MKKIIFYLMLVLFVTVGIGYGFLREVLRDVTMQTLDPLLIILFDIFSALMFTGLMIWLAVYISRNGVSKPLAILFILAGIFLTFHQLFRYSGFFNLEFISNMYYPGFSLVSGSFLLISGILILYQGVQSKR